MTTDSTKADEIALELEREISAVAASSIRSSIAAAPVPASQAAR